MESDLERYAQIYPHYREQLEALQLILDFQADQEAKVEPGPSIPLNVAQERWQAGLPLLSGESLSISDSQLNDALVALRPLLPEDGDPREVLDRLLASDTMDSARSEPFLFDDSHDVRARIQKMAVSLAADPEILALLVYTVLTPFYQRQAVSYRPWIETAGWRHGFCPLCGSEPSMARLTREEGRRMLACAMCRSEWLFDRLRCPFCEDDSHLKLRHFTMDDDLVHRVDCCDQCQRYIKIVDERRLDSRVSFVAEEVVTAHLDVMAREQGYR